MNVSDIISLRLKNQLLAGTNLQTPQEIVSWMGAMQAQDYNMAKWGIGNRLNGITDKQINESLNRGDIIRTHILRPTWHLVSKEDFSWMLPLSAPRLKNIVRSGDKLIGLDDATVEEMNLLIRKELSKGVHLTRQEIGLHLKASGIHLADDRYLNHVMFRAEVDGIACSGELKGKKQTYRLLEELVSFGSFDKDEALYKLAYKFFQSHGPATLHDFIWWSGLTITEARRSLELIKDDFLVEHIDAQQYIFHNCTPESILHKDVHLLSAFDEYLVSYKDRKEILAPHHNKKVITSNGIFQPFIINKGQTIGTWKKVPRKNGYKIDVNYFDQVSKTVEKGVEKAIKSFYQFLEQI